jgi:hypothetical protein
MLGRLLQNVVKAGGMAKTSKMGQRLGGYISKSRQHPYKYGIPAAGTAGVLGKVTYDVAVEPPAAALGGMLGAGGRLRQAEEEGLARRETILAVKERARQVRESIRANITMIARTNPQLYNELVAGRRLPRGAIILGGPPRKDLLEEVATMMAGG